jgi:hypothetical protein
MLWLWSVLNRRSGLILFAGAQAPGKNAVNKALYRIQGVAQYSHHTLLANVFAKKAGYP